MSKLRPFCSPLSKEVDLIFWRAYKAICILTRSLSRSELFLVGCNYCTLIIVPHCCYSALCCWNRLNRETNTFSFALIELWAKQKVALRRVSAALCFIQLHVLRRHPTRYCVIPRSLFLSLSLPLSHPYSISRNLLSSSNLGVGPILCRRPPQKGRFRVVEAQKNERLFSSFFPIRRLVTNSKLWPPPRW